jgi:hypothetical protein
VLRFVAAVTVTVWYIRWIATRIILSLASKQDRFHWTLSRFRGKVQAVFPILYYGLVCGPSP